jgi:hypothetical protein
VALAPQSASATGKGYSLDLDSTIFSRHGTQQQGAARGYNPRRPGRLSHHPLLAVLAEANFVLHSWLRCGNTGASQGATQFLSEAHSLLGTTSPEVGATTPQTTRIDEGIRAAQIRFSAPFAQQREGTCAGGLTESAIIGTTGDKLRQVHVPHANRENVADAPIGAVNGEAATGVAFLNPSQTNSAARQDGGACLT